MNAHVQVLQHMKNSVGVPWSLGTIFTPYGLVGVMCEPPESAPPHGYTRLSVILDGNHYIGDFPDMGANRKYLAQRAREWVESIMDYEMDHLTISAERRAPAP